MEGITFIEKWSDDNPEARQHLEEGLRILASMIVKAIMREKSVDGKTRGERNKDSVKLSSMSSVVDQQEKLVLTVIEAAKILGISRGSTYNAVWRGQIPNIRIGRRIVIPRASLINMLKEAGS